MTGIIYTGPWINYSQGSVFGSTLTLSTRYGGLLTALVAAFLTVVGTRLWRISSFVIHQTRAKEGPADALHHQQQVIFRNTVSPNSAAWSFLEQAWYWRVHGKKILIRTIPWALYAVIYTCGFAAITVFSSDLIQTSSDIRLMSTNEDKCGYLTVTNSPEQDLYSNVPDVRKSTVDTFAAVSLADTCSVSDSTTSNCYIYPDAQPFHIIEDGKAPCPFKGAFCHYNNTLPFSLSTTFDSHTDFGINAPRDKRLRLKKTTTCLPINTTDFRHWTNTAVVDGVSMINRSSELVFNLGPVKNGTDNITDWTYLYPASMLFDKIGYHTTAFEFNSNSTGWSPIQSLRSNDADTQIIFVAFNNMFYAGESDDPIFRASTTVDENGRTKIVPYLYIGTIACTEQYQVCDPSSEICSRPSGRYELVRNLPDIPLNAFQMATLFRIKYAIIYASMYEAINPRPSNAVKAQEKASGFFSDTLPSDQWKIEVRAWFKQTLARIQIGIHEYVAGPTGIFAGSTELSQPWKETPEDPFSKNSRELCSRQLVKDIDSTISFSVFGLATIFTIGALTIVISFTLDTAVGLIQKLTGRGEYARMNWMLDQQLQLQRMLYETLGVDQWYGLTRSVPITETSDLFGGWEHVYEESPRLRPFGSVNQNMEDAATTRWSKTACGQRQYLTDGERMTSILEETKG